MAAPTRLRNEARRELQVFGNRGTSNNGSDWESEMGLTVTARAAMVPSAFARSGRIRPPPGILRDFARPLTITR